MLHFEKLINWQEVIQEYEAEFEDAKKYKETGLASLEMAPSSLSEAIDYYHEVLSLIGELCGNKVSAHIADFEAEGLHYSDGKVKHPEKMAELIHSFHESGLVAASFKREYGGMGLTQVAKTLLLEMAYRCDTSFAVAMGSVNLASILQDFATEEQKQRIIPKLIQERYSVTMGLTEPNFGSDLAAVQTRAELKEGQWYISGTKRFQTMACGLNGDPAAILCLARTGSPTSGVKGLSFFLVDSKHYEIAGLEKKMGLKTSATCEVVLDKSPAELLGQQGYGLTRYVMGMLNGARMSVAAQGVGIATAAYEEARKYASERTQFAKTLEKIPVIHNILNRMQREIAGMRSLMLEAARTVDLYAWRSLRGKSEGRDEKELRKDSHIQFWNSISSTITPLAKYYNAEMANTICYDAIQIFGGAGFCEDYEVARLYRDVRIATIWDGTSQIQVNAAIGAVQTGLSGKGPFSQYLQDKLNKIKPSIELLEIFKNCKYLAELYKKLEPEKREISSEYLILSVSRFLIGLLYEEQETKLDSEEILETRRAWRKEFNIETLAKVESFLRIMNYSIGS